MAGNDIDSSCKKIRLVLMLRKSICIPWSFNTFLICAGKMSCKNDLSNWSWFLNTHVRPGLLIIFQFLFVSTNQKQLVFCCTKKDTNDKICMRACPDHSTTKQVNLKTQHSHLHFTFSTIFQENHTGWFLISDGTFNLMKTFDVVFYRRLLVIRIESSLNFFI